MAAPEFMEDDLEKREDDKITKNEVKESEAFTRYFSKKRFKILSFILLVQSLAQMEHL